MFRVSEKQISAIKATLGEALSTQKRVFEDINLNPYDFFEEEDPAHHFNIVVYQDAVNQRIDEFQRFPEEIEGISGERILQLESGSTLTPEEVEFVKNDYINGILNDDCPETWLIAKISDGQSYVFSLLIEQMRGQGGLHFNKFLGFFATQGDAEEAVKSMNLLDVSGF